VGIIADGVEWLGDVKMSWSLVLSFDKKNDPNGWI
jgi:hypothetical protein